ncbi:phage holin family protein [Nitrosococcus halophilus]|uniref:phage holin family protein n=1 Tax=Nitrosococcus halophilus TaxID=133539 RepID=UPI00059BC000|nr:phage holin family protein [Nitrosococcus halophilus]
MTVLVKVLFATIELIKAELQQSKINLFYFFVALAFFLVGMFFLAGAFVLILISIGLALSDLISVPAAILITGIIAIFFGIILIFIGNSKIKQ